MIMAMLLSASIISYVQIYSHKHILISNQLDRLMLDQQEVESIHIDGSHVLHIQVLHLSHDHKKLVIHSKLARFHRLPL